MKPLPSIRRYSPSGGLQGPRFAQVLHKLHEVQRPLVITQHGDRLPFCSPLRNSTASRPMTVSWLLSRRAWRMPRRVAWSRIRH